MLMDLKLPKKREFETNASLLRRVGAFVVDILVINIIILYPFKNIIYSLMPRGDLSSILYIAQSPEHMKVLYMVSLFSFVLTVLYFSILEFKLSQTIGKIMFNLEVKSLAGTELSFGQCFVRPLFMIPFSFLIVLWVVDPLFVFFNKEKQRLMEVLSKTKVVQKIRLV